LSEGVAGVERLMDQAELEAWGREVGAHARPPLFLCLRGELGAGKSVLARAVARGAGVSGSIPSPTYNLLFRYPGSGGRAVVHLDLYRVEDPEELRELGWEELGAADEIVMVEWPERAEEGLPEDRWEVRLSSPAAGSPLRRVEVRRVGDAAPIPVPGERTP
jgi:tRNA threonylcarbamoyladenosine biosynthesis protein TsaE